LDIAMPVVVVPHNIKTGPCIADKRDVEERHHCGLERTLIQINVRHRRRQ